MNAAQQAIQKLLEYRPRTARVIQDGREVEVAADALKVGDVLVVRPGERIAADGTVKAGRLGRRSGGADRRRVAGGQGEGDPVYTGTFNQFGRLEIEVEKVGAETTLGQVIRLMGEAQAKRSPWSARPTATPGGSCPPSCWPQPLFSCSQISVPSGGGLGSAKRRRST